MDDAFFASYVPDFGENWDVIKTGNHPLDGDLREFSRMLGFFRTACLRSDENFGQACELIDVEAFLDYMILNIWAQNQDWPQNNWYAARPRVPGATRQFLVWDAEFGLGRIPGGFSSNTLEHVFNNVGQPAGLLFARLMQNRSFQTRFIERLDEHLEADVDASRVGVLRA